MRFYGGGDPLKWLKVPKCLLEACLSKIPQLEAEENLRAMTQTALGTGSGKQDESRRILRDWNRRASGTATQERKPSFNLSALGAAGVKVKKVSGK